MLRAHPLPLFVLEPTLILAHRAARMKTLLAALADGAVDQEATLTAEITDILDIKLILVEELKRDQIFLRLAIDDFTATSIE